MPTLRGHVYDARSGATLPARVHVLESAGKFRAPPDALLKVGGGPPFFYSDGTFALDLLCGPADVVVERGTEYRPLLRTVEIPRSGTLEVELPLERWINLPAEGWHAGNTHIHYNEQETRPDERRRLDPQIADLSVAVISALIRRELPYASNKYPVGRPTGAAATLAAGPVLDVGEETRHNRPANGSTDGGIGYGHLMLINLAKLVEPLSRGSVLVAEGEPDYPPLIDAADEAHRQGGVAIWCHNGQGMEAPVAASLGKLDAFNLFDPFWMDPEWDVWYDLLTCGLQLPASTGSDWFICSSNRVYAFTGDGSAADLALAAGPSHAGHDGSEGGHDHGPSAGRLVPATFDYGAWLAALQAGRTFITNGPALFCAVEGAGPGTVLQPRQRAVDVVVRWQSSQPIHRVEIVADGEVVARAAWESGRTEGTLRRQVDVRDSVWLAARCFGDGRDSFGHFAWVHTSPVYFRRASGAAHSPRTRRAAAGFVQRLDAAIKWVRTQGHYRESTHRDRMIALFQGGRDYFAARAANVVASG